MQASWFATGEHRVYDRGKSSFRRVTPLSPWRQGGAGGWELAARVSHTDLEEDGVSGDEMTNLALGVSWYLERNMRATFNYVRTELDEADEGADLFLLRLQLDF